MKKPKLALLRYSGLTSLKKKKKVQLKIEENLISCNTQFSGTTQARKTKLAFPMFDGVSQVCFRYFDNIFCKGCSSTSINLPFFLGGGANLDTGRNQEADLRVRSKPRPNRAPAKKSRTRKEKTLGPGQRRPPSRGSCPV